MKPVKTPTRIHYFYENILRNDLLLKLNCLNAMEIPRLNTVIVLTNNISQKNIKNTSLALEIICAQKAFYTMSSNSGKHKFSSFSQRNQKSNAKTSRSSGQTTNSEFNLGFIMCSLRSRLMYNFLEKLLTFLIDPKIVLNSLRHLKIQIHGSEIQFNLRSRELRLFPEIQNHFELFEDLQKAQIKIITSAKNEKDAKLLWEGLEQKEI